MRVVAAGNGDVAAFDQAYGHVTELHKTLLEASLAKADDGKVGSWGLIPDSFKFPERPLHEQWASSYRSLFDAAVNLLPREFRPLRRLCYVVQHLMGLTFNSAQSKYVNGFFDTDGAHIFARDLVVAAD